MVNVSDLEATASLAVDPSLEDGRLVESSQTYTIPNNDSVEFEIGTQIEIQNDGSVSMLIAITDDTLTSSADGTTGTRTLAASGEARIVKVEKTKWKIRGENLT